MKLFLSQHSIQNLKQIQFCRYLELKEEDFKKIRGTAKVARKIEKIINP